MDIVSRMFKQGVLEQRYTEIIEIYPRKATNSEAFEAALYEISKTHELIMITKGHIRAMKKEEDA